MLLISTLLWHMNRRSLLCPPYHRVVVFIQRGRRRRMTYTPYSKALFLQRTTPPPRRGDVEYRPLNPILDGTWAPREDQTTYLSILRIRAPPRCVWENMRHLFLYFARSPLPMPRGNIKLTWSTCQVWSPWSLSLSSLKRQGARDL